MSQSISQVFEDEDFDLGSDFKSWLTVESLHNHDKLNKANHGSGNTDPAGSDSVGWFSSDSSRFKDTPPGYTGQQLNSKMEELKQALQEVNDAYKDYKTSELLLSVYKITNRNLPYKLAEKKNGVIISNDLQNITQLRTNKGETFNVLGLEEEDIASINGQVMSLLEKNALSKHMRPAIQTTIKQLTEQKKNLKGMFEKHCLRVKEKQTVLSMEQGHLVCLADNLVDQCCSLLQENAHLNEEIENWNSLSKAELQKSTYLNVLHKAKYLQASTSVIKHKVDQIAMQSSSNAEAISLEGDKLISSIAKKKTELEDLKKTLEQYKKKESNSEIFRKVVEEYNNLKAQLEHKHQVLALLNESDTIL